MKTLHFFYAFILFIGLNATAQQAPFMVCNAAGTTCTPHTTLDAAYTAASAGSYIYLPAGNFSLSISINKEVHFIGAGFDVNASVATGITSISGNILLESGANNSSFEGFYLVGNFRNYGYINNITFANVNFNRTEPQSTCCGWYWSNCTVKNSVVRGYLYFGTGASCGPNNLVMNSFVNNFYSLTHSTIKNCVVSFDSTINYCFYDINNSTIKNCIIGGQGLSSAVANASNNVVFLNNATTATAGQLANGKALCTETNNIYGIVATDTFETATAFTYDYTKDYHLKTTSTANNAGDDGTDIGIYGSNIPWKVGAIPSNPHIASKNISGTTDSSGNLPVQITVTTQN